MNEIDGMRPELEIAPKVWPRRELLAEPGSEALPGRHLFRPIVPAPKGGWPIAVFEWTLEQARWTDEHPHIEINTVIEGELHIEGDGFQLIAGAGESISVPANIRASYYAPVYARMVGCYGPNHGESDVYAGREPL